MRRSISVVTASARYSSGTTVVENAANDYTVD